MECSPLYVSADSILDAVYRSYDAMLKDAEESVLSRDLSTLLSSMRRALPASAAASQIKRDADLYLAVALGLLEGAQAKPVAGASAEEVAAFIDQAVSATGHRERTLFGRARDSDFSQFKPRGHYTASAAVEQYFRAMMWLGRIDLRMIETTDSGEQLFHLRQLEAAVLLRELLDDEALGRLQRIDATLEAFVGRSDSMRVSEVDALLADLGATSVNQLAGLDPQRIAQTVIDKGYGAQQIASQLIVHGTNDGAAVPLDRAFALFGQRYTVDAHVLSNVVHDRVPDRLMPNPLDAAYAAFGNDAAADLLGPDLDSYAAALESTRQLVDAHDSAFWTENLYNAWSKALRALSPTDLGGDPKTQGLPLVTGTAPWDARLLNTQLASWSQLRHNTVLYAKQSYTSGVVCAYPDAYVEPYPEFFGALVEFARQGNQLAHTLAGQSADLSAKFAEYFDNVGNAAGTLGKMAEAERAGTPFTSEQLAFINDAVHQTGALFVCGGPQTFDGWYAKLDYEIMPNGRVVSEVDPVITDVHTQPTDLLGNDVGRILHVGTGLPRLMVMTADTCQGPRAYAGVVASYYELTTEHWQRLTDADWSARVQGKAESVPSEPEWTQSFIVAGQ